MIIAENYFNEMINAISREIKGRVELYDGSTLLDTYTYDGALQSFVIDRVGEADKFFGFGICQKCTVKLKDKERAINIKKGQGIEVVFGVAENYLYTCPIFYVDDVQRDENTNDLTIIAYDAIYQAANYVVNHVEIQSPYTIRSFVTACASLLGMPIKFVNTTNDALDRLYDNANYNGTETLRDVLDDIAEATQTIYYLDAEWNLTFRRLDVDGSPVLHLDKSKYFSLTTKTSYTLQGIMHVTELGDNVSTSTDTEGVIYYVKDNPWWDLRDDIDTIVEEALANVVGLTFVPFDLKWRANFLCEIGDKISMTTKDDDVICGYILNDSITYNGGLNGRTRLNYASNESKEPSTPTTLYDAFKQTYARVDKVNAQIDLVVHTAEENTEKIAHLQLTDSNIAASVDKTNKVVNSINNELDTLTNKVNAQITAEDVQIQISEAIGEGVDAITTTTGYTFNESGLTISKDGSEMTTTVTEDGMSVKRNEVEMLRADNTGCYGTNLYATTYLVVGGRSRFENYKENRTGCFWVGGEE